MAIITTFLGALSLLALPNVIESLAATSVPIPTKIILLGGTGKIGTSIATHLLQRSVLPPESELVLVGRNAQRGQAAVQDVIEAASKCNGRVSSVAVKYSPITNVWDTDQLTPLFDGATAVIHTAGPYQNQFPTPLKTAIDCRVPVYVDVSDPLEYLEASLKLNEEAKKSGTAALVAAGAFPGLSNLLAVEAVDSLPSEYKNSIRDVGFNYFTAGLGGSGNINLYITNLGFGEEMPQYDEGRLRYYPQLSGKLLGKVDFFINKQSPMAEIVGTQSVFSWPFPEAATVPKSIGGIRGRSHAAMGTAPDAWNIMLGLLVAIVPRSWWRNEKFSKFIADFSQPLVLATDALLKLYSADGVGETHAMRIDVTASLDKGHGSMILDSDQRKQSSSHQAVATVVQGHQSFRQCVGQSCAEFCIDLMEQQTQQRAGGVSLVEKRYQEKVMRKRIIEKMTSTPGTIDYSGPVVVVSDFKRVGPSNLESVLTAAE